MEFVAICVQVCAGCEEQWRRLVSSGGGCGEDVVGCRGDSPYSGQPGSA